MSTFLKTIQKSVKHWYIPAIIGVLLIGVGIYTYSTPIATYATLTIIFSISFLFTGLMELAFAIQNQKNIEGWGWYLMGGIFDTVVGFILLTHPAVSAAMLPIFIGFTLLFRSMQGLGFAFEHKNYGSNNWGGLAFASALGLIFSLLLIFNPIFAEAYLVVLTSLAFVFVGFSTIVLAFQLKKLKNISSKIQGKIQDKIEDLKEEYYDHINKN
ncbi:HdeD family acid-resistance protein [Flavobacterium sp. I3-2]|uniref:HdeD family acid-resistance protein n=1 Tax=Flavobacterium sp. I3-2 TaxID=2748319 RepID=UPI0015A83C10|nr:DUF308 domain-containing protein [Flavobacterium sp. I3-2]